MDVPDQPLFILLDRYLAGEASAAEAAAVRDWLADDPTHAGLLEDLRMIKRVAAERPPDSSADAAWAKALEKLQAATASRSVMWRVVPPRPAPGPRAARARVWVGFAAAAVLALVLVSVLSRTQPWREFATDAAHRLVIRLRDGTEVTLAPRSRLRYQADYGATRRDLRVEGQAYFRVAHDAARPFRVHTRGSVAEALGTAFAVSAYGDELATEVVVTQGRVALWQADTASRPAAPRPGAQPALMLVAGDLGRLDLSGAVTIQRGVDVERYVAWTRGVLVFDSTPLGEVVLVLERWYDVEIHLADSALGVRRLTATFRDEPLDLVLERIALTLGLRVERTDRSVLLVRKRR